MLDDMVCPHCGSRNHQREPKPLRRTRSRWQPKHMSREEGDYQPITVSEICQKRLMVSFGSRMVAEVVCEGCPSAFNCLTGNIDDGIPDTVVPEDNKAKQIAEAKVVVEKKEKEDKLAQVKRNIESLAKLGFTYYTDGGKCYAKFRGTIWKLSDDDVKSIMCNSWNTPKTMAMKNTLINRKIDLSKAQEILCHLMGLDKNCGSCYNA